MPSPLLKTKLPYPEHFETTEEALSYIVKTLNSSFSVDIAVAETNSTVYGLSGVEFSSTFSITSIAYLTNSQSFTFNHNFGSIPSAWVITDMTWSNDNVPYIISRTAWTSTQITIKIVNNNALNGTNQNASGTFKILVLR